MYKPLLLIIVFIISTVSLIAQYGSLEFYCHYNQEDSVLANRPVAQPDTGTANLAIVLCVEKGQEKDIVIDFINDINQNLPDYFDKATFGYYDVNVTDILVKSMDSSAGLATVFELPSTIVPYPPIDTSFVVNPWMVKNILAQADSVYDFNDFDSDGDGIVDFLAFMLIKFANGWSTGTTGLSINSFYTTNDTTSTGASVLIDGRGYLGYSGDRAIIQRKFNASSETLNKISVHELGHALFDFPDMLRGYYNHYALGQFCAMAGNGFGTVAALYDPVLRINKGWTSPNQLTSNTTINFSDFDLTGQSFYYELPYYSSPPQFATSTDQKFYLTYYSKPSSVRWQSTWPVPESLQEDARGILIWHTSPSGWWSNRDNLPIDIESAHGKWDWIIDKADTVQPPNDIRAIRSNDEDPLYGYDSLEVKYSYRWLKYDAGDYIPMSTYPDNRIGSESCFFDPLNPQNFSFTSNPSSNSRAGGSVVPWGRTSPSGFKMEDLRLEGGNVKADILVGDDANTIDENVTLSKGTWAIISDVIVASGATLTLQPGTILYFSVDASLIVNGTLNAIGTSDERIIFTSLSGTTNSSWGTITFNGSGASGSTLKYANIKYGTKVEAINTSDITVQYCNIDTTYDGVRFYNSSGSILNNTITSNSIGHGIIIDYGSTDVTVNDNIITKTYTYRRGVGIYFGGGAGGFATRNDIYGWDWGICAIWGSSPTSYSSQVMQKNNRIRNCNTGFMVYRLSYPIFGLPISTEYYSLNSASNNSYNARVGTSYPTYASGLYAFKNWWGSDPPDTNLFQIGPEAWLLYDPYLDSDPWSGSEMMVAGNDENSSGGEDIRLSPGGEIESLLNGIELRLQNKYSEAKDFFISYIANNPDNQAAYVELYNCYSEETANDLLDYFSSLPREAAKDHKLLLSYLYFQKGNVKEAKVVNNTIIAENSNPQLTTRAKLNNVYIALYNEGDVNEAIAIFNEVMNSVEFSTPFELNLVHQDIVTFGKTYGIEIKGLTAPPDFDSFEGELPKQEVLANTELSNKYELVSNYPNPFNPITTIDYSIKHDGLVSLKVYDMLGSEVVSLVNENQIAGNYSVQFDASNLPSGIYIYRLTSGQFTASKKLILLK